MTPKRSQSEDRPEAEVKAEALNEAACAARGMHDPVAPDCAEWADWLDARAASLAADPESDPS